VLRRAGETQPDRIVGKNDTRCVDREKFGHAYRQQGADVDQIIAMTHEVERFTQEHCKAGRIDSVTLEGQLPFVFHRCPMARGKFHR
jgi:hypothetical protein